MRKHVCIYNRKCWCGAGPVRTAHDRVLVAGVGGNAGWPCPLESLAVEAEGIQQEADAVRKAGVPTDFTKDGRPIMESRAHYKAYLKLHGYHERSQSRFRGGPCA